MFICPDNISLKWEQKSKSKMMDPSSLMGEEEKMFEIAFLSIAILQ